MISQARCIATILATTILLSPRLNADEIDLGKLKAPLTKIVDQRTPRFELDVTDTVDPVKARKWGEAAIELCEQWFPALCMFLDTQDYTPPEVVNIVFKKDLKVPGATSGNTITVDDEYVSQHPDDFGMMIHELIHVIQAYPQFRKKPGWLVEGIADYVRYWKYESERPRRPVQATENYHDGYGTTGAFLAWITWKYDRRTVKRLDGSLRNRTYNDSIFHEITGKNLPELWEEFIKHEQRRAN
jgi:hypothetical protein